MTYQTVNLADLGLVGDPIPLPPEFANLSDEVVSDFSAHIDPPPVGYEGKGLWPLVVSDPVFDPATEATTGVLDPSSRRWTRSRAWSGPSAESARSPRPSWRPARTSSTPTPQTPATSERSAAW